MLAFELPFEGPSASGARIFGPIARQRKILQTAYNDTPPDRTKILRLV